MCMFSELTLVLDKQWVSSSLGKTIFPAHSIPVVLYLGFILHDLSPFHISISIDVVHYRSCLGSLVGDTSWLYL